MLLRLTLLSVLISACYASSMLLIAETMYKPCIVHGIKCPADGSLDLKNFKPMVESMMRNQPPKECRRCNLKNKSCFLDCYYLYLSENYMAHAGSGKTSASEIADARAAMREYLRNTIRPCVYGQKYCGESFTLHAISKIVRENIVPSFLPRECVCNPKSEKCIRVCYYAYIIQIMLRS